MKLLKSSQNSFYIPELANKDSIGIAFIKIINIIDNLSKLDINTKLIAKKNQIYNNCENTLVDLCKSLF